MTGRLKESFLIIGAPLAHPSGASLRLARVVPRLARLLKEGFDLQMTVHFPRDEIEGLAVSFLNEDNRSEVEEETYRSVEEAVRLMRLSDVAVDEGLVDETTRVSVWSALRRSRGGPTGGLVSRASGFGYIYSTLVENRERSALDALDRFLVRSFDGVRAIYASKESLSHVYLLSLLCRKYASGGIVMLQQPPYGSPRLSVRSLPRDLANIQLQSHTRQLYRRALVDGNLKLLMAVSATPLLQSGILGIAAESGVRIGIPTPANAFDEELPLHRSCHSEQPTAVFYGRLTREKGVFDALQLWSKVLSTFPHARLLVIGSFQSPQDARQFYGMTSTMGLRNIEYLGAITRRRELYDVVSRARVLIYPSYQDSFSLVILESLALGLAVVAYDLPALRVLYGNLPPVRLVRLGDIQSMAIHVCEFLGMEEGDLSSLCEDAATKRFLQLYSSWEKVAEAEYSFIRLVLGSWKESTPR